MYFITVIVSKDRSTRTWGFYHNLKDALHAIDSNQFSMQECLYDYLILEKFNEGIPAWYDEGFEPRWFNWNDKWEECQEPNFAKGIIHYGIG